MQPKHQHADAMNFVSEKTAFCTHCDEEVHVAYFTNEQIFCCQGCLTVYQIIHNKGLGHYYQIKNNAEIYKRRAPVSLQNQKFLYLDTPEFLNDYSYKNLHGEMSCEFYLEGIHCLACLWLIEKIPDFVSFVTVSHLDINKSTVTISLAKNNPEAKFSLVARELNNLGYAPHPLKKNQEHTQFKIKEERKMLLKIGIAGAGAANIMLYAFSIYAGAEGNYAKVFNLLTVLFALPVFLYSATPFYHNAWSAIKYRRLSIDIPISLSLIVGFLVGIYYQIMGINENFFDSLTALVFLLLLARYFLNKIQEEGLKASDLNFFYQTSSVLKKDNHNWSEIHPQYLKKNDVFKILQNEMIPVDGIIESGKTKLNNALLTGETRPVAASAGDNVYSGTINLGEEIIIKVINNNEETRLGKILKQVENSRQYRAPIVDLTNRISKYFIIVVLALAAIVFAYYLILGSTKEAWDKALTLLIVTCPCALALATPLTLTRTLSRAAKKGIIIKNDEVIEKLSKVKKIFLDKTGTLTFGSLKVTELKVIKETIIPLHQIILALETKSKHQVALALCEFVSQNKFSSIPEVKHFQEQIGSGVKGEIAANLYQISKGNIWENEILVATYKTNDKIRPEAAMTIDHLKKMGIHISLISGDQTEEVKKMASMARIDAKNIFSEVTPEEKLRIIEKNPETMMVGDGANDAMALSNAYVGVAVQGSMEISLVAAQVYLTTPGIKQISDLLLISRETMKVIYRNLILSLAYNGISVYLAFAGLISPLTAAIVMPLSSLTVLFSTLIGTPSLNKILNNKEVSWKS